MPDAIDRLAELLKAYDEEPCSEFLDAFNGAALRLMPRILDAALEGGDGE